MKGRPSKHLLSRWVLFFFFPKESEKRAFRGAGGLQACFDETSWAVGFVEARCQLRWGFFFLESRDQMQVGGWGVGEVVKVSAVGMESPREK